MNSCDARAGDALVAEPAPAAAATTEHRSRLSLQMRPGHCRSAYASLVSAHLVPEQIDPVINLIQARAKTHPAWEIGRNAAIRRLGRHPDMYPFIYSGSVANCATAAEHVGGAPGSCEVLAVDHPKAGSTGFLVTTAPAPPAALIAGGVVPLTTVAHGQLVIDLAAALDAPCLLLRADPDNPSLAMLHRCATQHNDWRLTFVIEVGTAEHVYPDRFYKWMSTVPGMIGTAVHAGHTRFVGHDIAAVARICPRMTRYFRP